MTLRDVFYAPGGTLRAWCRVAGFVALYQSATWVFYPLVRTFYRPGSLAAALALQSAVMLAAVLFATIVMLRLVDGRAWSTVGLGAAQAKPKLLLLGIVMGALAILLPSGVLLAVHWLQPGSASQPTGSSLTFGLQAAALLLPAALAEELVSRGYAFAAVREGAGPIVAIALTSVVFSAMHVLNPGYDARAFGIVMLAGIWLGAIVALTRSVYAAWMAHFAWNFAILGLLHAPLSGLAFPSPGYTVAGSGPEWATGGSWGPEGSALAALSMIIATFALYEWSRRRRAPEFANA